MGQLTKHIVTKLRKLQTQTLELLLRLGTQRMTAHGPEIRYRRTDRRVVLGRVLVDVSGIGDLALGRGADAVDLTGRQVLELLEAELFCQRVDLGVFEELVARVVDLGDGGVGLELARVGELAREVFACVEEFEEAAYCVDVFVGELDLAGLLGLVSLLWLCGVWAGRTLRFHRWRTRRRPRQRMDLK